MGNTARKRSVEVPRKRVIDYKRPAKEEKKTEPHISFTREFVSVLCAVTGLFLLAALASHVHTHVLVPLSPDAPVPANLMGQLGAAASGMLFELLGWCSFVAAVWAFLIARIVWCPVEKDRASVWAIAISALGSVLMAGASAVAASVLFGHSGGGLVGSATAYALVRYINQAGALLISAALFVLALGLATGFGTFRVLGLLRSGAASAVGWLKDALVVISGCLGLLKRGMPGVVALYHVLFSYPCSIALKVLRSAGKKLRGRSAFPHETSDTPPGGFVLGEDAGYPLPAPATKRRTKAAKSQSARADSKQTPDESDDDPAEARALKISRRLFGSKAQQAKAVPAAKDVKKSLQKRREKRRKDGAGAAKAEPAVQAVPEKEFELPPLDLLVGGDTSFNGGPRDDELINNCKRLEQALADFRIGGKVVEVHPGPVITLYQFEPAAGVKVQRIINLADDLALALKVGSVRVYAPVPGKGTVGIEVPNVEREIVRLRDILDSPEWSSSDSVLTLALGKDTFGDPFVADLSKMPHLLIAGATGTGKSVSINSILLSLLFRSTPDDLRLVMIDPKMLELSIYEDIPHLKAPVVTNPKRARGVLWWAVEEMERRYRLMKGLGVRNLAGYNKAVCGEEDLLPAADGANGKVIELEEEDVVSTSAAFEELQRSAEPGETQGALIKVVPAAEKLPRIVIVVDELADLMLTVGREIEMLLTRLAQKARAAGIHLILATQRPSVDVITGLIKANFPARISFKVASRIDARTVMDSSGAEKLLGMGDMLFLTPGAGRVRRLHAAFVSDKEVQDVVAWLRRQGSPDYDEKIEQIIDRMDESEKGDGSDSDDSEYDPLYDQAVNLVIEKGAASTSMVQRVFRIGYNRAARILETMERDGVVGPADGAKPRQVYVPNREKEA